ncbi:MAG TPA: hypothetical protein VFD13_02150 [Candidatus Kapabacteria bacterium]|nr:hypothetical protein [Candidatus Kapabacteria bacterium]
MPEKNKRESPRESSKKIPKEIENANPPRSNAPRDERHQPLVAGVRSLSTPPGEPYNDVLLRRPSK